MTVPCSISNPTGAKSAIDGSQTELQLNEGNHLRLRAAQNVCLRALRGTAWITVEWDAGETVVKPGDAFVLSSGKTALVGTLHGSVTMELGIAPNTPAFVANRPMLAKLRRMFRLEQDIDFGTV